MSDGSGFVEEYRHLSARETFLNTGHEDALETASEGVAEIFERLESAAGPAAADD